MSSAAAVASGKSHGDENFPVASHLIEPRHRAPIMAFYHFVRAADDVADHATLPADEKIALLDALAAGLTGEGEAEPVARTLRDAIAERGLSPRHALDLIEAFRVDCRKNRYQDWDDLIGYCRLSAMPVGRFVLDVHGESEETWAANDALCAALQIINHLQDCAKDYRDLDRVYIPRDAMLRHGIDPSALSEELAGPGLKACIVELAERTHDLLRQSRAFAPKVANTRLALEIAAIQALAETLVRMLKRRDPLSDRVHLGKGTMAAIAGAGVAKAALSRLLAPRIRRGGAVR